MTLDPESFDLERLFDHGPKMFDSRDRWRRAGFEVLDRSSDNRIMVASHASVPGFLFKKYCNDVSFADQEENYARRIEGVVELKALIDEHVLQYVVVPNKWLYQLPDAFGSPEGAGYVLIVEQLELLDDEGSKRAYRRFSDAALRELCVVLHRFRGLDSTVKNMPLTEDGCVAFIDTEHWDRQREDKPYLRYVHEYLSRDGQKLAKKIFKQLDA